jgi:hypothetical protein
MFLPLRIKKIGRGYPADFGNQKKRKQKEKIRRKVANLRSVCHQACLRVPGTCQGRRVDLKPAVVVVTMRQMAKGPCSPIGSKESGLVRLRFRCTAVSVQDQAPVLQRTDAAGDATGENLRARGYGHGASRRPVLKRGLADPFAGLGEN